MILRKLEIQNKSDIEFVEKLYIESFPQNERRSLGKMHDLIEQQVIFDVYLLILNEDIRIGFYTVWIFDSFSYLEHFAISPEYRNGGYGQQAISKIINKSKLPLIGEIELPEMSNLADRRQNFYKRQGFRIWDIPYFQPPYEDGYDCLPMKLITYGDIDMQNDSKSFVNRIYQEVYKWDII